MDLYHYFPDTLEPAAVTPAEPDPLELAEARQAVRGPLVAAAQGQLQAAMTAASAEHEAGSAALTAAIQAATEAHALAIAEADAAADQVEPSVWLVPAFATLTPPPASPAGQVARFVGGEWLLFDVEPTVEPGPPAPPTEAQLAAIARADRDQRIASTRWLIERHRDELDLGGPTTLDAAQFGLVLAYVQQLRDVPTQAGFPADFDWPAQPSFIPTPETI